MPAGKKVSPDKIPEYVIPEHEREALQRAYRKKVDGARLAPSAKIENNKVTYDHPEPAIAQLLLGEALGGDSDFTQGLLEQLANATPDAVGSASSRLNFLLSVVKSVRPRDQIEAMLAAQMAIVHMAVLATGKRLLVSDTLEQQDSSERAVNKLSRTFTGQIEALKRYRDVEAKPASEEAPAAADSRVGTASHPVAPAASQVGEPAEQSDAPPAQEPSERVVPLKRAAG